MLLLQHARDMPLGDVRDFVAHHARQLGLRLRSQEKSGIDANESAGQREGVDLAVVDQEEFESPRGVRGVRSEAVAQRIDVVGRLRVIVIVAVGADLAHDGFAQPPLLQGREARLRDVAEVGQPLGESARDGNQQHGKQGAHPHSDMIIRAGWSS